MVNLGRPQRHPKPGAALQAKLFRGQAAESAWTLSSTLDLGLGPSMAHLGYELAGVHCAGLQKTLASATVCGRCPAHLSWVQSAVTLPLSFSNQGGIFCRPSYFQGVGELGQRHSAP